MNEKGNERDHVKKRANDKFALYRNFLVTRVADPDSWNPDPDPSILLNPNADPGC